MKRQKLESAFLITTGILFGSFLIIGLLTEIYRSFQELLLAKNSTDSIKQISGILFLTLMIYLITKVMLIFFKPKNNKL